MKTIYLWGIIYMGFIHKGHLEPTRDRAIQYFVVRQSNDKLWSYWEKLGYSVRKLKVEEA